MEAFYCLVEMPSSLVTRYLREHDIRVLELNQPHAHTRRRRGKERRRRLVAGVSPARRWGRDPSFGSPGIASVDPLG